jgi:hypothetical protein
MDHIKAAAQNSSGYEDKTFGSGPTLCTLPVFGTSNKNIPVFSAATGFREKRIAKAIARFPTALARNSNAPSASRAVAIYFAGYGECLPNRQQLCGNR